MLNMAFLVGTFSFHPKATLDRKSLKSGCAVSTQKTDKSETSLQRDWRALLSLLNLNYIIASWQASAVESLLTKSLRNVFLAEQ